jgi:DNA-binding XRE family transcriptional regulator
MRTRSKITDNTLKELEKVIGGPLTLGKVIYASRMCEECTQVEFAKKLGISRQHLCDIEKDRKFVSPKLAAAYAKKLGDSEIQFVRLALQDELNRAGLEFSVELKKAV